MRTMQNSQPSRAFSREGIKSGLLLGLLIGLSLPNMATAQCDYCGEVVDVMTFNYGNHVNIGKHRNCSFNCDWFDLSCHAAKLDCERIKLSQMVAGEIYEEAIHDSHDNAAITAVPLTQELKDKVSHLFPANILNKVRYTTETRPLGLLITILSLAEWAFEFQNKCGIALGDVIVMNDEDHCDFDPYGNTPRSLSLWTHELEHVVQYEQLGIDGFAQAYTFEAGMIENWATQKQALASCSEIYIEDCLAQIPTLTLNAVKLYSSFGQELRECSGALIDPKHVLTSGRCVHQGGEDGIWAGDITAIPNLSGWNTPYGMAKGRNMISFTSWVERASLDHDIGVIELNRPVGSVAGWLDYAVGGEFNFFRDSTFHNISFPTDPPLHNGREMHHRAVSFTHGDFNRDFLGNLSWVGSNIWFMTNRGICLDGPTCSPERPDDSGSVFFREDAERPRVYAVHSHNGFWGCQGLACEDYAYAVRLTSSHRNLIKEFVDENTPSEPDLIPLAVEANPRAVKQGEQLSELSFLLHNYSTQQFVGTVRVDAFVSKDDVYSLVGDSRLIDGTDFIEVTLGPKESGKFFFQPSPTIPADVNGNGFIIVVISDVADFDDSNNAAEGDDAGRTTIDCTKPAQPLDLSGPSIDCDGSYTVGWAPGPGSTPAGYTLQRSRDPLFASVETIRIDDGRVNYVETGLGIGTYYYRVAADGVCDDPSTPDEIERISSDWTYSELVLIDAADPPTILAYPRLDIDANFPVRWFGSGSYTLQRAEDPSFSDAATVYSGFGSSYQETGLEDGIYYYRVRRESECGISDWKTGDAIIVGEKRVAQQAIVTGFGPYPDPDMGGWIQAFDSWLNVGWPAYNAANGEARVAAGDLEWDTDEFDDPRGIDEIVIGLGPDENNAYIPFGVFRVLDNDFSHLAWGAVDWREYNLENGETWPAVGDVYNPYGEEFADNLDEIIIGLGEGGQGAVEIFVYEGGVVSHQDRLYVDWPEYNSVSGETRPATGDLDGDGWDEIVVGFDENGQGRLVILDDAYHNYQLLTWTEIDSVEYSSKNGESHPACGDVDDDGIYELLIGLGPGGEGLIEVKEPVLEDVDGDGYQEVIGMMHREWIQAGWPNYNSANGETRPSCRVGPGLDLDNDFKQEVVVGFGEGGWGLVQVLDDANTGFETFVWLQTAFWPYMRDNGATWPAMVSVHAGF